MNSVIKYLIFLSFILSVNISFSQNDTKKEKEPVEDQIFLAPENDYLSDTSTSKKLKGINSNNVYNRLTESKSRIVRNFSNIILIGGDPSLKPSTEADELDYASNYFKDFEGLVIDSIIIETHDIYFAEDSMSTGSWFENTLDKIHIQTRERIISKYLLFKVGDKVDPLTFSTNEFVLRKLPYISSAYFMIKHSDTGGVVVKVFTRDSWTILATGSLGDYPYLTLYDENFLGTGNKLLTSYLHPGKCQKIGGQIEYIARNISGSFIEGYVHAGFGEHNRRLIGSLNKEFNLPGDSFWFIEAGYIEKGEGLLTFDTTCFTSKVQTACSYGKSFKISKKDKSMFLYGVAGFSSIRYIDSPPSSHILNPYYNENHFMGAKIGIAKQNFFQGNMIYGYGNIEDIPYGFKFEILGGWGESPQSGHCRYLAFQARYGFYKPKVGFFDFTLKGAIRNMIERQRWERGVIDFTAMYFSPLAYLGKGYYLRNFVNIHHTQGINRLIGEKEKLLFNSSTAKIRGISTPIERLGTVRTVINLESVLFTPLYLLHFRFAGFLWSDIGWLGDKPFFWNNDICSAVGIGVRIKNERLIIDNLELRLGFAVKKFPERGYSPFGVSNEARLDIKSYDPDRITEYDYK